MIENRSALPEMLYVYECGGPGSPRSEPEGEGFLGVWPEASFFYLFYDRPAEAAVSRWLQRNGEGWFARDCYQIGYRQWQQLAAASCRVGPFLLEIGPHQPLPANEEETTTIRLDPGVVFGAGLHETTQGCLLTIAELFQLMPIKTVVDLGTGTGILALACARLGASQVAAVDCNPLAVRVARTNAKLNNQQGVVRFVVAENLEVFRTPSALLLMNLEWPCLTRVLTERQWLRFRWVIMSGFLRSQLPQVKELLAGSCRIMLQKDLNDWVTLLVATDSRNSG